MTMGLEFNSNRDISRDVFPIIDRLNNTSMNYHTLVHGDFPTLTFTGTINGEFRQGENIILATDATYELVKDHITIQNNRSTPAGLKIYAQVSDLWNNPTFQMLELKDLPMDSLSTLTFLKGMNEKYRGDFYFSGPVNFPTTKISFSNRKTQEVLFSFTGNASNLIQPNLKFRGHFLFETRPETVEGNLLIENNADNLALQLDVPSMINGNLSIGYGEQALFQGILNIIKFPINQYIGRFSNFAQAIGEGNLLGTISFNGTTDQPTVKFDLQAQDFIINNNGYYSAVVQGSYENSIFQCTNTALNYNSRPIILADINWDIRRKYLRATFRGDQIESNFVASTIFKDARLVQGDMNYQLTLEGRADRPNIHGTANMQNGILKDRVFTDLHAEFEDSIPPSISLFQIGKHIFHIRKLTYHDKRDYSVQISGIMPADPGSPMNLKLDAEGNILAEVPSFLSYFRNPICLGELLLNFSGTRENPKIESGRISIYNGSMEFESVIPPLKDMKADIELKEGEQFLRIRNLEGKINNRSVRIFNLDSVKVGENYLEPWRFEDFGINLGVLVLETDKRGIPLSIPGLMNPGDIGYFEADGKENGEQFYFSGPVDKPEVRGKIVLRESRVTFPFLETPEPSTPEEENKVIDFLMNIKWDITTIAGTGNRYFVDIPALLGEVYLDLNIDNVSEGLEFTGRLSDESFRVAGSIESSRGRVEYLDMNFRVDRFGAIFNTFELFPEVYGKAWTTVRDSTNFPRDIYLVLYAIDPETKQEVSRGRWEDFRFKLVSSDPTIGETQENVLSYLGYSVDNISSKASDIGMTLTDNLLIRPLVRPLERKMERGLGLDYVRLNLQITSNIYYYSLQPRWKFLPEANYGRFNYNTSFDPALLLLQSSEITLGKYLMKDIYFSYSGQLVSVYDEPKFGLNHRFGVEYRLLQNLLLEFEYDKFYFDPKYYSRDALQDFRIRLKHSFNF